MKPPVNFQVLQPSCGWTTLIDSLCCVAVPAPPSLYTKVVNSSVVQAMWEPSSKMGQHQGFRLYYRRAHTPLFSGPITFPRNVTQFNITQLGETRSFLVTQQIVEWAVSLILFFIAICITEAIFDTVN